MSLQVIDAGFPAVVLDVWGGGQLLAFSGLDGPTPFFDALTARVSFVGCGLDIKLPGECSLCFGDKPPSDVLLTGDVFRIETSTGEVKGAFLDSCHLLVEGPCEVKDGSDRIAFVQEGRRTLVGSRAKFDARRLGEDLDGAINRRLRWLRERQLPPDLSDGTRRTCFKALSQLKTQIYAPEEPFRRRWSTPDRWPHRHLWLWDSTFHAAGLRHIDVGLARELVEAVFDVQRDDGFIPLCASPEKRDQRTQPPVLALGVKLVDEIAPDNAWLERLFPKLEAYVRWDLENRDADGDGLVEWQIEQRKDTRSGESGMDNSPRFDISLSPAAVDFNAFLAHECELLSGFAGRLNLDEAGEMWAERHATLCRLINEKLWDPETGLYIDYDVANGRPSPVHSSVGFLPLLCGAASAEQAARLVAHLGNPETFGTPFRLPSIAANSSHYARDMWRGPVWMNVNWLIAHGLRRYGFEAEADGLLDESRAEIERLYEKFGAFFEFYDDRREVDPPQLLRKGRLAPEVSPFHQVFFDYGWTGTLYLDAVFMAAKRAEGGNS